MDISFSFGAIRLVLRIMENQMCKLTKYQFRKNTINFQRLKDKLQKWVGQYDCVFITLLLHIGFIEHHFEYWRHSYYAQTRLVYQHDVERHREWLKDANGDDKFIFAYHELNHHLGRNYKVMLHGLELSRKRFKLQLLGNPIMAVVIAFSRFFEKEIGSDLLRLLMSYVDVELAYCDSNDRSDMRFIMERVRNQKRFDQLLIVSNLRHNRYYVYLCQTSIAIKVHSVTGRVNHLHI